MNTTYYIFELKKINTRIGRLLLWQAIENEASNKVNRNVASLRIVLAVEKSSLLMQTVMPYFSSIFDNHSRSLGTKQIDCF